jgi:hypothetical protein
MYDPWCIAYIKNTTNDEAYFYYKFDTTNIKYYHVSRTFMLTGLFGDMGNHPIKIDTIKMTVLYKIKPNDDLIAGQCMGFRPSLPISACVIKTKNKIKVYKTNEEFNDAFQIDKDKTYVLKIE